MLSALILGSLLNMPGEVLLAMGGVGMEVAEVAMTETGGVMEGGKCLCILL